MENSNLPKFVNLLELDIRFRLVYYSSGKPNAYYRDGGQWYLDFKIIDGELLSWLPMRKHLHRKKLIKCSEKEWRKCNGDYAPDLKTEN